MDMLSLTTPGRELRIMVCIWKSWALLLTFSCMRAVSFLCIHIVDGELDVTTMDPTLLSQIQDNQQLGK